MSESFKEQCIALRKQDKSIIEIMEITGRPKTSIYQHIQGIPLSARRVRQYRVASGQYIRKFALARKGKSVRRFQAFNTWTPALVLLVAHLIFDGEIMHVKCVYNNRSQALIDRVERHMRAVYHFEPKRWQNPVTGVFRLSYHNVALGAYLHRKAVELLKTIRRLSPECKTSFLRGFFDDEGCMDFRPKTSLRKIRGYQKDIEVLTLVRRLLADLDIPSEIKKPNEVVITGKESLLKFEKTINFSKGVYMNGNRTNSRWKKHMEKRELLRQAILSYKT